MKPPRKKQKNTDELAVWVQTEGRRRGLTERFMAERRGVSTATIRRAKATPLTRDMLARYAAPSPAQREADAARLATLLQEQAAETEADEPMVDWLADLLAAEVEDGAGVVFRMLPGALLCELARDEHVVSALACIALVSADTGDDDDTQEAHATRARDLLAAAAAELVVVQAKHFPDDSQEIQS